MKIDLKAHKRVTFYTLLALFSAICLLKLCLLSTLMAEDYDAFASAEAFFLAFAGLPMLISGGGALLLDFSGKKSGETRLLSLPTVILICVFAASTLLELVTPIFYYMGAASSLCGIAAVVMIIRDIVTRAKRRADFAKRDEAKKRAREAAAAKELEKRRVTVKNERKGG